MFVKPKEGLAVRDPQKGDYLPAEGREVTPSQWWSRRLKDGDVTEGQPPKPKKGD
ncbi:DUF2635 domain-containing protein [Hwanghaeella sp.]|uniref:DUF2635 domain-containing protein n=1 Tax=Hwanghaeella sp. TaxID=2605943 RepID=UPI003CCBFCF7